MNENEFRAVIKYFFLVNLNAKQINLRRRLQQLQTGLLNLNAVEQKQLPIKKQLKKSMKS